PRVISEVGNLARSTDEISVLPDIRVPTLVIAEDSNAIETMDAIKRWQTSIPNSELAVISRSGYQVSASRPDECVSALLGFLDKLSHKKRQ
ncbi:alpha/beta fold hydrolase, partial [Chloroflexota bacterium]